MTDVSRASDAQRVMLFEANKKSLGITYALWFFLGMTGAHRFYTQRPGTAVAILLLFIVGLVVTPVLLVPAIWVLVDAFLIPGWIRTYNNDLIAKLSV